MKRFLLLAVASCAAAEEAELRDYRGIFHCHSHFSHDSDGTEEEIVAAAKKVGVDFIFMTDHPSPDSLSKALRGKRDGVYFIAGAEVNNILALDLRDHLKTRETVGSIEETRDRGGIAFAAHPEEWKEEWWAAEGLAGMEIYNLHADVKDEKPADLLKLLPAMKENPDAAITAIFDTPTENLRRWDSIGRSRRFVGIAANDAHQNVNVLGFQLDPYDRVFRFVNTHLLAKKLTRKSLREALLSGRVYVAFEWLGPATGFRFTARKDDRRLEMGSEETWAAGWEAQVDLPDAASWRILKDGDVVARGDGTRGAVRVDGPGVWRAEAWRKGPDGKMRPWVYANPVYFRDP